MELWETFWSTLWWFFCAFVFIAYLMALISVMADVIRDRDMSGWFKALWVILLIFVPFVTAVVYLILRGRGMAQRRTLLMPDWPEYRGDSKRGGSSPAEEIERAAKLRDAGIIGAEEFERLKSQALS